MPTVGLLEPEPVLEPLCSRLLWHLLWAPTTGTLRPVPELESVPPSGSTFPSWHNWKGAEVPTELSSVVPGAGRVGCSTAAPAVLGPTGPAARGKMFSF